jgi:CheY-like chemotaxis protein
MVSILIVDDNEAICRTLRRLLLDAGLSAVCVTSGLEALHAIAERPPSAVLLDQHSANFSGIEMLRRIRHRLGRPELPAVMFTVDAATHTVRAARELGAAGLYDTAKPPTEDLIGVLRRVIAR